MSEEMTVICANCESRVFHGQACPWCETTEVIEVELETDETVKLELQLIEGGRDEEAQKHAA